MSQLAPFHNELQKRKSGAYMPPFDPGKVKWVCLWIFEELAHYCAWCQYMLPSLFIHTYMSNILIFLLQESIQIFVHLKTIYIA